MIFKLLIDFVKLAIDFIVTMLLLLIKLDSFISSIIISSIDLFVTLLFVVFEDSLYSSSLNVLLKEYGLFL